MYAKPLYSDQFKRNDEEFRNTMEAIFQKYSSLNDPGIDICLRTMTCRTVRGPVAIDSAEGERELEALKTQVKADYSMREFDDQDNDEMDVSTEDDLDSSGQKENSENLWHGGEAFQLSTNPNNTPHGFLWEELSQPKEEDEELEKTLSSHGSTLLDVYPSMLNQIGEAYRRQHVTDTARAVVQKYRRKHWQAGSMHHNSSFKSRQNSTLNKTTNISFTQSPAQRNISNCFKGSDKLQNLLMNKSSPVRNSSSEASACFYSPRRNTADVSGVTDESLWTDLHLTRKPDHNTARVIDLTTPPYSGSPSSPDLDQTYDVGVTTNPVPAASVFTSPRQSRAGLPVIGQRGMSIISRPSSLDKDCFRDRLHSSASSPQHLIGVLSPSGKSSFRPSVLNVERQLNLTASPKRKSPVHLANSEALTSPYGAKNALLSSPWRSVYGRADHSTIPYSGSPTCQDLDQTYDVGATTNAVPAESVFPSPRQSRAGLPVIGQRETSIISRPSSLDKDCFRDRLHSPVSSPQCLIGVLSPSGRSSFRPSVLNVEKQLNSTASPKRKSPVHLAQSEAFGSPYGAKNVPLSSPRRSVYDRADQSLSKLVKPSHFTPSKRQRSLSGPQSTLSFSEPQIDAEFRKLYHHFICRGSSSPCPSSHCHLCERHMKETSRSPSFSSSSMSALALTPLRAKLKKRQRQPEVEESLRFKRFRESRSPLKHLQLTGRCVSAAMSELTEDKLTWDRAVLLQCPSPRFLRGTGNLRRIREAKLSMQMNPHTLSWRDAPGEVQPVEVVSPMRPCIQGTAPLSPSLSRRRLQYGLLQ
ncbi:uncharacterized protein si:dkeyp-117h8.4 [Pseudorasbora parva]|uniref:uncharacterized protein si:dkeyp-117h8.4 n=1 Tax=Pseudorasbora parva TaxID=51549 RepID=UPI00351ED91C